MGCWCRRAGFDLTGKGTPASPLAVDPTQVQKRVNDFPCDLAGRAIKQIQQDGSVTCTLGPKITAGHKAGPEDIADDFATIGGLPLPTGKWLVIAKVLANSTKLDPANEVLKATCQLIVTDSNGNAVAGILDRAIVWGDNDFSAGGTMTMMVWADSAGFGPKAVVQCRDEATSDTINAKMEWRRLTMVAIQLDAGGALEVSLD